LAPLGWGFTRTEIQTLKHSPFSLETQVGIKDDQIQRLEQTSGILQTETALIASLLQFNPTIATVKQPGAEEASGHPQQPSPIFVHFFLNKLGDLL